MISYTFFNTRTLWAYFLILFILATGESSRGENLSDPLIVKPSISLHTWHPGEGGTIKVSMHLPTGYHGYLDKLNFQILSPDGFLSSSPVVQPTKKMFDKFSKKDRVVFKDTSTLTVQVEAPISISGNTSQNQLIAELTYQACSDQVCLFPVTKKIEIPIQLAGYTQIMERTDANSTPPSFSLFSSDYFNYVLNLGLGATLLFIFIAGIFTSFTPCIFPMIPITLAILAKDSEKHSRWQNFLLSIIYVHGIATTYSLLGILAAKSGHIFGASLGSPIVLSVICFVFLAMALSMYGLYEIQLPQWVHHRFGKGSHRKGYLGAYLSGMFAGIVASPCVGPVLVAILAYVSTQNSVYKGILFLFTYAMGLGLIFIILGLSNQATKLLPRSGTWMNGFKFILGSLMLSAFYYYLNLLVPHRVFDFALGAGLITLASVYGAFANIPQHAHDAHKNVKKAFMLTIFIIGVGYTMIAVFNLRPFLQESPIQKSDKANWKNYDQDLFEKALRSGKPVILDFYADWCAACVDLEEKTFSDRNVSAYLERFEKFRFDATKDSEELLQLKKKYEIQGLPSVLFFDSRGQWVGGQTLNQFEKAELFLKRLEKIK